VIGGFFPRMGKLSPQRITPGLITPIGAVHAHREWVAVLGENKWFEFRLNFRKMSPRHHFYLLIELVCIQLGLFRFLHFIAFSSPLFP